MKNKGYLFYKTNINKEIGIIVTL